jgi:dihydroflavonol-4-reductase
MNTKMVFVSGAAGFIGSHVVKQLLAAGYRVRGSVRSLKKVEELRHLRELPGAAERLELVEADLLAPGAFDAHVQGADYVLHLASPFVLEAKDPQKDLVDPAVRGTRTMLEACQKSPRVKRVVLTSSMAAVTDEPDSDHVLTEADWNEKSSLQRNAYYYSKTLAERAAWQFMAEEKPHFDLIAMNPYIVIGPSMTRAVNPSNQLFVDLLSGTYPGIMNLTWGFVDVRDVALGHIRAMTAPAAEGRYLCTNATLTMREVVELLHQAGYGTEAGYKVPRLGMDCAIGDYAARLGSYLQPKGVGQYLRTHIGRLVRFDNAKVKRDLGLEFRALDGTIRDTLADLVKLGHVAAPREKGLAAPAAS